LKAVELASVLSPVVFLFKAEARPKAVVFSVVKAVDASMKYEAEAVVDGIKALTTPAISAGKQRDGR
jgi:hypothetical protein